MPLAVVMSGFGQPKCCPYPCCQNCLSSQFPDPSPQLSDLPFELWAFLSIIENR